MKEALEAIYLVQEAEARALALQDQVLCILERLFELRVDLVGRFAPEAVVPPSAAPSADPE